jgi:hypothetical protein
MIVRGIPAMADFRKSFEEVRERSRLMREDGGW